MTYNRVKINPAGLGKFGRRNVVINGAMQIAQKSNLCNWTRGAAGYHTLDRMNIDKDWKIYQVTRTRK